MSKENNNQDGLTKDILNKIKEVKPKSKNYFLLKELLLGAGVGFFLVLSMFSLASFLYDFDRMQNFFKQFDALPRFAFLADLMFEFLFISLLGGVVVYFVYRKTDWILVKYKLLVVCLTFLMIIFGGVAIFAATKETKSEFLDYGIEKFEGLPFKQNRAERINQMLQGENVFVGVLKEVKKGEIVVQGRGEVRVFVADTNNPVVRNIPVGQVVVVDFEKRGDDYFAKMIKPTNDFKNGFLAPKNGEVRGINENIEIKLKEKERARQLQSNP